MLDFWFDNGNNKNALKAVMKFTKQSDFQLLHISILREYLQMEFCLEQPQYDLEAVIDDFVFMTYLVGNDFLPHMVSNLGAYLCSEQLCIDLVVATK